MSDFSNNFKYKLTRILAFAVDWRRNDFFGFKLYAKQLF